jgi:uncharacterized metal-binding protein YceD (DUF177 family)
MSKMPTLDSVPFSYPVKVGHISANPVTVKLSADEKELAGLARLWKVVSVESLSSELQIARWKKDGVRLRGHVNAKLTQSCVVTLDPVVSEISEDIEQIYVPEGSKLARQVFDESGELILDPDGDDLPETFVGDTIDVGATIAEIVALGIDPYPRKGGVEFTPHIESTEEQDKKPSPFAVLKDWKKD